MRAYLAGFGTAGSLLAGAALLFVLASGFVAFRGWPKVGAEPAPASVVVSAPAPGGGTPAGRRLAAIAAGAAFARVSAPAVAGGGAGFAVPAARPRPVSAPTGVAPGPGSAPSTPSATVGSPPGRCTTGCGGPTTSAPVVQTVNHGVSDTRSRLGSTITASTNTAAGALHGTNGSAAATVQSAGALAGGAVSHGAQPPDATSVAGGALAGH